MNRSEANGAAQGSGTSEAGGDAAIAIRRANGVWVMPAARIKQILRGTFLENPSVAGR